MFPFLFLSKGSLWKGRQAHEYFDHYNRARPHRALGLRPPDPQPIPERGQVVRRQRLCSLINEYSRAA